MLEIMSGLEESWWGGSTSITCASDAYHSRFTENNKC